MRSAERRYLPVLDGATRRRATTVSMRRTSKRALAREHAAYPPSLSAEYDRPTTRAECLAGGSNAQRPCPWASCAHHLALDVARNGNIKLNRPSEEIWEMSETCSLDVADDGGVTLLELGALLNLTRERSRQIAEEAMARLREHRTIRELVGMDDRQEPTEFDDGSGSRSDRDALDGLTLAQFGDMIP